MEKELCDRLKYLRAASRMTWREISDLAGTSRQYVEMIESGASDPTVSKLEKLLSAYGVGLAEFFGTKVPKGIGKIRPEVRRILDMSAAVLESGNQTYSRALEFTSEACYRGVIESRRGRPDLNQAALQESAP